MFNFMKIMPMLLKLKDVSDAVKDQYPEGKPFYYSKRFWGSVTTVIFGVAAYFSVDLVGSGLSPDDLADKLVSVAQMIGSVSGTIYGLVMLGKGVFDSQKRKKAAAK